MVHEPRFMTDVLLDEINHLYRVPSVICSARVSSYGDVIRVVHRNMPEIEIRISDWYVRAFKKTWRYDLQDPSFDPQKIATFISRIVKYKVKKAKNE